MFAWLGIKMNIESLELRHFMVRDFRPITQLATSLGEFSTDLS